MKLKYLISYLLALNLGVTFMSCNQADPNLRTQACFTTQHHNQIIPNIAVYVKFDAIDFPGYDNFNQFNLMQTSDRNGRVCFNDIPLGNHWFVAIGYDEEIREQVIGNIDIRFDLSNLRIDQILYVGEE